VKNELVIHHHLGLGDHFDMNGMVRHYLNIYDKVHVFSKESYLPMVEYMYRDNDNIIVHELGFPEDELMSVEVFIEQNNVENFLRIGFENYPFGLEEQLGKNCWEFFYEQVGVPKEVRVRDFYCKRDEEEETRVLEKLNPTGKPFVFVHDDPARGFKVDRSVIDSSFNIIENDTSENIFYFLKVLEEAEAIHCMESSFKSLVDLYAKTEQLHYHDFRNQPLGSHTNKKWHIIKYD
tara:strand:- start:43 stop:747 length:705 start_codon:yes stop_codon:yes gene_type:complete